MAERITVSHSEVESYLRCERQHFYGYGMEIQRVATSDALSTGIFGHKILELFFKKMQECGDWFEAVEHTNSVIIPAIVAENGLDANSAKALTAINWFFASEQFSGWKILAVEQEYVVPVADDLEMPFVVDLIAADKYGDNWLIDNKFVYDFYTMTDAELMPQIPKYMYGLSNLGIKIDKTAYSMYRTRSLKTADVNNMYQFLPFSVTPTRVAQTAIEQFRASGRIQEIKRQDLSVQSQTALRTANKTVCQGCSFRSLCVAELNDWQPNLVLNAEYQAKVRREFNVSV